MATPPKRKVNAVLGRTLLNVRRIYGNNTGCGFYDLTVGQVLRTKFANSVMPSASGLIEGTTIKVSIPLPQKGVKEVGCSGGHVFSLIATLDFKANPNSMAGLLSVNDCAACPSAEFRAVREQ
jgi:hypothetical protein